jgi:hypothetical protein
MRRAWRKVDTASPEGQEGLAEDGIGVIGGWGGVGFHIGAEPNAMVYPMELGEAKRVAGEIRGAATFAAVGMVLPSASFRLARVQAKYPGVAVLSYPTERAVDLFVVRPDDERTVTLTPAEAKGIADLIEIAVEQEGGGS